MVDGENGFLAPVMSVEPLADAIEKLILDADMRERFGRRGREIVLAEFDEKIVLDRTIGVYGEILNACTRHAERGSR